MKSSEENILKFGYLGEIHFKIDI